MEGNASQPQQDFKILCKDFPPDFIIDKTIAKKYFKQFGKVKRVAFKSKQRICTVSYTNRNDFLMALSNAGFYNGQYFTVVEDDSPTPPKKKIVKPHSISYIDNDEVQQELLAMRGQLEGYRIPASAMSGDSANEQGPKVVKPPVIPRLNRVWKKDIAKTVSPVPILKPKVKEKKTVRTESVSAEQIELIRQIKSQAFTVDEKYKVLDARDKLLRLKMKKHVSHKSSPTVGTCPDMCPEKERLMREVQHQVALYEQDEDRHVMNSKKAVKQYSRSSADQEAPLPHELRPVEVLQMTMAYLMHSIMDLCDMDEVNLAEWFHFLWDRTRGIRKDITQQNLCCQGAVQLVEQCARFHIHCSARLVAEELSVFDQKINTENLTKCLQTLKYMYNDLRLKGESCPNEAEFRAYIILLNISDGNFMWEVQQLREEIQKSPEVKFALQIYSAYDKRNYVKFFKLIKFTTYLNACILMRYFVQVRITALQTLSKCFTPPKNVSLYPINEIQENLYFDDFESTIDFLQTYGIDVNPENTHFVLDRKSFKVPDFPYLLDRSMNVEKKRLESVGQTVCGDQLLELKYLTHQPQNSFDINGFIIFNDILKEADLSFEVPAILKDDEDSSDVILVGVQEAPSNVFGQGKDIKKTENYFGKESKRISSIRTGTTSAIQSPVNIFSQKTTEASVKDLFKQVEAQPTVDQVDSSLNVPTNIFAKSTQKTATPLIFKETSTNIFGGKVEDIKKSSIFQTSDVVSQPSNIFGTTKKVQYPSSNIFGGNKEINTNIFAKSTEADIFEPAQEFKPKANIFGGKSVPKPGGFTFVLPKTDTERKVEAEKSRTEVMPSASLQSSSLIMQESERQRQEAIQRKQQEELRQLEMERMRIREELQREIEREEQLEKEKQKERERLVELRIKEEENKRKEEEKRRREEEQKRREELERIERMKREEQLRLKKLQEAKEEMERKRNLEIKQTVDSLLSQMVEEIDIKIREETLARIRNNIYRRQLLKVCKKWQNIVLRNIKKRKAIDCSPFWINTKNLKQCANDLYTNNQDDTLKLIKRYRSGKSIDIPLATLPDIKKCDILNLTYSSLKKRLFDLREKCQKNIFWKAVFSLPDEQEFNKGLARIEEILTHYIAWKEDENGTYYVEKFNINSVESATYCIEMKKGLNIKQQNDINGVVFIAEKFDSALQLRIFENLKSLGCYVKVPVVLIVHDSTNAQQYLNKLQQNGIVSTYLVLKEKSFTQQCLIEAIDTSLLFLVRNCEKTPPLELDTLSEFISKHLGSEVWQKAKSYAKWNPEYRECLRDPNVVITLYNEGLKMLGKIISDKDCTEYSSFPEVFKSYLPNNVPDYLPCNYRYFPEFWKNPGYLVKIKSILRSLELPKYKEKWPPKSEGDLFNGLSKYCSTIFIQPKEPFLAMHNLLMENEGEEEIYWSDAVEILTKFKLKEQNLSLDGTKLDTTVFKMFVVVYVSNKLDDFRRSDWFYRNNPVIDNFVMKIKQADRKELKKRDIQQVEFTTEDYNKAILKAEKLLRSPKDICVGKKEVVEEINRSLEDLETSIKIMKKVNTVLRKFVE